MSDIARQIKESGAIKHGEFQLSDGILTDYYIDKYVFETEPTLLRAVTDALAATIDPDSTDVIAGPALGAVPLITALSLELDIAAVIVRKSEGLEGTQARIEGNIEKGMRAVIVEDVTMTGKTVLESARVIEGAGGVVDRIVAVVDRNEGAADTIRDAGYEFQSVIQIDEDIRIN
jgi:orotate phosphoribosyltransferase